MSYKSFYRRSAAPYSYSSGSKYNNYTKKTYNNNNTNNETNDDEQQFKDINLNDNVLQSTDNRTYGTQHSTHKTHQINESKGGGRDNDRGGDGDGGDDDDDDENFKNIAIRDNQKGVCHGCGIDGANLRKATNEHLCEDCRNDPNFKLITKTTALKKYPNLTFHDLINNYNSKNIRCYFTKNWYDPNCACIKLYHEKEIKKLSEGLKKKNKKQKL